MDPHATPADNTSDVIVLAGHGVLAAWLVTLLQKAADTVVPPVEIVACDGEGAPADLGRAEGAPRLILVAAPGAAVLAAIGGRGIPVIAVLDDPLDGLRVAMTRLGLGFLDALRLQTRCAVGHSLLFGHPRLYLLRRGTPERAWAIVVDILRQAALGAAAERGGALDRFGSIVGEGLEAALQAEVPDAIALDAVRPLFSAEEAAAVRGALAPLLAGALTAQPEPIVWTRAIALFGDDHSRVTPPVTDLTGPARILLFGPYCHLPAGEWTVRLLVAFSKEAQGVPFGLRLLCLQERLADVRMQPPGEGAFECSFAMTHVAAERWVEIQFSSLQGMIDGHVAFGRLEFRRPGPARVPLEPARPPSLRDRLRRPFRGP